MEKSQNPPSNFSFPTITSLTAYFLSILVLPQMASPHSFCPVCCHSPSRVLCVPLLLWTHTHQRPNLSPTVDMIVWGRQDHLSAVLPEWSHYCRPAVPQDPTVIRHGRHHPGVQRYSVLYDIFSIGLPKRTQLYRSGEMAQQLRTPFVPAEDPGSIPSTHRAVRVSHNFGPRGSDALFWPGTRQVMYRHTDKQNTHLPLSCLSRPIVFNFFMQISS